MRNFAKQPVRIVAAIGALSFVFLAAAWWMRNEALEEAAPNSLRASSSSEGSSLNVREGGATKRAPIESGSPTVQKAGATTAAEVQPGTAVIVQDEHESPIAGAQIEFSQDERELGTWSTDSAGRCEPAIDSAVESVSLRVSAAGFAPGCEWWDRDGDLVVVLTPVAALRGRVMNANDGMPVAGAHVAIDTSDCAAEPLDVVTDGAGRFERGAVPLRQESVWRVSADGYATLATRLEPEDPAIEIELRLEPGMQIDFLVVDALSGAPIEGASVADEETTVSTDAEGRATSASMLAMDDQSIVVAAGAEGYCSTRAIVLKEYLDATAPVRIPLLAAVRLEGRALDSDGAPVAGIDVVLDLDLEKQRQEGNSPLGGAGELIELPGAWSLVPNRWGDAVTDESGHFSFGGLEPLSPYYRLRASRRGEWLTEGISVARLGQPGTRAHADVSLSPPTKATIVGTLTLNGVPTPGRVAWRGADHSGSSHTDSDGQFSLENLEPGPIELIPKLEDQLGGDECGERYAGRWIAQAVRDETVHVDLALELDMSSISGRVTDASGAPAASTIVSGSSSEACWASATRTGPDGEFELTVSAGPGTYVIDAGYGPNRVERPGVAAGAKDLELVLSGAGKIRLRVVDNRSRAPLDSFVLQLTNDQGETRPRDSALLEASVNGWREIQLREGSWGLFVSDQNTEATIYLPVDLGTVNVGNGRETQSFEVALERGSEIDVQLAREHAPAPADVVVLMLEAATASQVAHGLGGWSFGPAYRGVNVLKSRRIWPSTNGPIRVYALRPGSYRFVAFPDSIAIEPAEVVVAGNENEPIEIRWKPR